MVRRRKTASYGVAFWLFVLVGVGVGQRWLNRVLNGLPGRPVLLEQPLSTLPKTIEDWMGGDIAIDTRIMEVAGADDYLARRYVGVSRRDSVGVYVAYASRPATMIGRHPDKSFPANGWLTRGAKIVQLMRPGGKKLECRIYYFSREDAHWEGRVVLNYFVLHGRHITDPEEFSGPQWRQPNFARDPAYYVAHVQVVAVASDASEYEQVEAATERFAAASAGNLDALLPLAGEAKSGDSIMSAEKSP
ncbi:MAG: exosortase-associated EpsI family protein [Planctomycetes bacterium]|nr:exosortase-associated EpsI family protein [Planctomycetota bacterium]MBI3833258.1 exosortase-associated EpsI family protein [Planctomycetota bacterium]